MKNKLILIPICYFSGVNLWFAWYHFLVGLEGKTADQAMHLWATHAIGLVACIFIYYATEERR